MGGQTDWPNTRVLTGPEEEERKGGTRKILEKIDYNLSTYDKKDKYTNLKNSTETRWKKCKEAYVEAPGNQSAVVLGGDTCGVTG